MSEIQDNTLPIEIPVKRIRLTYQSNLGLILVLGFLTLSWELFTVLMFLSSQRPIKRMWNDWVISKNYEVIPNAYAEFGCYEYESILDYVNCGVIFNVGNRFKKEKLRDAFESYPYSWQVFLAPKNLPMEGESPMVRSVDDPSRTSFLFGIETLKIRFLSLLGTKAFQLLIVALWFYGLYLGWKIYYWRIFPNNVKLKAVKIYATYVAEGKGKVYYFFGLSLSIVGIRLKFVPSSVKFTIPLPFRYFLGATQLRNGLEPIFLDKEQTIGIAIEAQQASSGSLLDYNLTYLVLSKKDKEELIANIKAYQHWIAQNPEKLQQIRDYIDQMLENRI